MLQLLPFSGMTQAQGSLLQQQFGLIRQQQTLRPVVFQPVQQQSGSVPIIIPPTPPSDPATYTFTQVVPAAVWTINHNLGAFPSVTLTDQLGNTMLAQIQYVNSNQVVVTFSQPVAGTAYLNV
jgi:hypothetical protein